MLLLLLGGTGDPPVTMNYWTGSAWVAKPLKRWDGAAWVSIPSSRLKYWNGAAWQTT